MKVRTILTGRRILKLVYLFELRAGPLATYSVSASPTSMSGNNGLFLVYTGSAIGASRTRCLRRASLFLVDLCNQPSLVLVTIYNLYI